MPEKQKKYNPLVDVILWVICSPFVFLISLPLVLIKSFIVKFYAKWFIVQYTESIGNAILNMNWFHLISILGFIEWVIGTTGIVYSMQEKDENNFKNSINVYMKSIKISLYVLIFGYICHLIGG